MSVLHKIAYFQGRRDEVPNQELAAALAASEDSEGIREIAANLWRQNSNVQSDCVKVLYEIGYVKPGLIAPFADDFVRLLRSRHNRLVWGAMIALSTVAEIAADVIYPRVAEIQQAMADGSVITVDAGILTLARLAASSEDRRAALMPFLLDHLRTCRPKDVPQHAEKIVGAVTTASRDEFIAIVQRRMTQATPAQLIRLRKVVRQAEKDN